MVVMPRLAALLIVFVLTSSPALAVVCGFLCQPEPVAQAEHCHGERSSGTGITAATDHSGCTHDVAAPLLAAQGAKVTIGAAPAAALLPVAGALDLSQRHVVTAWEFPPGASPGAAAVGSTVLRI